MLVDRRNLLRTAAAAPAVPLLLSSAPAPAQAQAAPVSKSPDRFAIAVLPDTQYLFDADSADPAPLRETFRYLVQERAAVFLTHLGDVTEHGTAAEIALASKTFEHIDGKLPYSVLAGNHDINGGTTDERGDSPYLRAFGPHRFAGRPTFLGASPGGYNSAHRFTAGGRDWMVLALDWQISDAGLAWARDMVAAHPRTPVIVTTHDLAFPDYAGKAALSSRGQRLWDGLIAGHDQIFLTLNGHHWPPARTVLPNAAGHDVHVHITNYQDRYYGGAAMIRLYTFDLARNAIDVETFSPWFLSRGSSSPLESEVSQLTGPDDRFSLAIDFRSRFAGFDPPVLPAPRPAAAVISRQTVAYWRFDGAGQSVGDGAVVRDQTGKGNDLTVRRLANSGPEILELTADHHENAPAHASLRFDGGKNPDRGAILQTGANAPLNSMKFLDGYTIETFLKLPDPFVGDHAFMGIWSFEGRNGDAGKTNGWSRLECTCSLNLSSERFLQYVVYPETTDASPTSWSHALPMGQWVHVAVVNDSRHTIVYVDGAPIVRNPGQLSRGIATLGRPFTVGATSFDLKYGQGFYGWLGDIRVTARALTPKQFLTSL
ncbi:LamG-like jellyroll fold domain-containing protein [Actinoplanes sp. NPDC049265]|uniref:LamG-like jellyroll fold domain-containing protein n=1 Tax=Actinoplanes sp. NPDC049265 TaxID=3363902 RepID=UPI003719BE93